MCTVVKGDPPFEFYWQFDGRKIHSNDGVLITRSGQKMSMLYIESVQRRHAGEYTCVVESMAGFIKHSALLRVNGTEKICKYLKII